jgi:hypothetical protein
LASPVIFTSFSSIVIQIVSEGKLLNNTAKRQAKTKCRYPRFTHFP